MAHFLFFLTTTALFDSLSTAIQIVIFVFLFTTRKPLANSLAFLAGLSLAYLACGLVFLRQEKLINEFIARWFPSLTQVSDPHYYLLQIVGGLALIAGGVYFGIRNWKRGSSPTNDRLKAFLVLLNPITAAIFGVFLSVTGFPVSIPYLGALEKLSAALGPSGAVPGLVYYNFIYIVPLLIPLGIYLLLRGRVANIEAKLHLHSPRWGSLFNNGLSIFLGILFVLDSSFYFLSGHPLLTSKFF